MTMNNVVYQTCMSGIKSEEQLLQEQQDKREQVLTSLFSDPIDLDDYNEEMMVEEFITKGVYKHLVDSIERERGITINDGTEGHCDWGDMLLETTMKHDWVSELVFNQDTIDHIKRLKQYITHDYQNECKGNFNKVIKGNRHSYPFWHKGRY